MQLNLHDRILTLKVVYYGPALGGKTTNVQTIHRLTARMSGGELISIATRDDRTLFFDLLPMGLGKVFGHSLKLQLYTVPGQLQFDLTRRKVLAGADAVVFVADSQRDQAQANALSLKNLRINLMQNKLDPKTIPLVLQFNKRDLPDVLGMEEMNEALNERGTPPHASIATTGHGVMETLAGVVSTALETLANGSHLAPPAEIQKTVGGVRDSLLAFAVKTPPPTGGAALDAATRPPAPSQSQQARPGTAPAGPATRPPAPSQSQQDRPGTASGGHATRPAAGAQTLRAAPGAPFGAPAPRPPVAPGIPAATGAAWSHTATAGRGADGSQAQTCKIQAGVAVSDDLDLLEQAVAANLALSERLARDQQAAAQVARREAQVAALAALAQLAEGSVEAAKLEGELLALVLKTLDLGRGSLLAKKAAGGVIPRRLCGHERDPLSQLPSPPFGSVAERMIATGRLMVSNDFSNEILYGQQHPDVDDVCALVFSPLRTPDGLYGGLFLYCTNPDHRFDGGDEMFVRAACGIASLARLRAAVHAG